MLLHLDYGYPSVPIAGTWLRSCKSTAALFAGQFAGEHNIGWSGSRSIPRSMNDGSELHAELTQSKARPPCE